MVLMIGIARQHTTIRTQFLASMSSRSKAADGRRSHSPADVRLGLSVLSLLMFSKLAYVESFRSFYTFYLIDRFHVSIATSQLMLFIFFVSSAAGVLLGGIVGEGLAATASSGFRYLVHSRLPFCCLRWISFGQAF